MPGTCYSRHAETCLARPDLRNYTVQKHIAYTENVGGEATNRGKLPDKDSNLGLSG